jgi:hypothetical protein
MLGRSQMVAINKEKDLYTIEIKGPIRYSFNANSAIDLDIIIALLNESRTLDGQKIIPIRKSNSAKGGIHLGPPASGNVTICARLKSRNGNSHKTLHVVCATTLSHAYNGSIENFQPDDSTLISFTYSLAENYSSNSKGFRRKYSSFMLCLRVGPYSYTITAGSKETPPFRL